jgi:anthranilate phosphoribosyltransferase
MTDEFGEWPLSRLVSEVVGSGPKSADDMTPGQAREAFARLLDGDPDPVAVGAFLLANRWKRNTPAELGAFVDAMRERSVRTAVPSAAPVDCGANYDGKTDTVLLGVAAGVVAAGAGTPVVAHSADRVPVTRGDTYRHVLDELGVATDLAPAESAAMVDEVGFGFYYQPQFDPGVHGLLDVRERMRVRTFLNTVETLANPADATAHLGSFFHLSFAERLVGAVRESATLPFERVVMVQGLEGYDDVRPGRIRLAEWDGGDVADREFDTAEFGLDAGIDDLSVDAVAPDSARLTEAVVAGDRDDEFADAVALNAGLRVYAAGDTATLGEGVERARDALVDGSAAEVLAALRAFDPGG